MSASTPARAAAVADASGGWTPGPAEPALAGAAVDVWRVDLSLVRDDLLELLSAEERERAARLVSDRARVLWSRSRGVLRALLGRYLNCDGHAAELTIGEHGKPELVGPLHFNLSHSRHLALYAFATAGPVGIDVQLARDRHAAHASDFVALARRWLGESSARRLAELGEQSREREFLRLWSRYEAELKCRGSGIAAAAAAGPGDKALPSTIVELDVAPDAAAALALGFSTSELRRWQWT